jgi:hypothetical protein
MNGLTLAQSNWFVHSGRSIVDHVFASSIRSRMFYPSILATPETLRSTTLKFSFSYFCT